MKMQINALFYFFVCFIVEAIWLFSVIEYIML